MIVDKIEGDCTLIGDEMINGMVDGTLTVESGVHCLLNGMVTGDLVGRAGAVIEVNGTVCGSLVSEGATVDVRGVVSGRVIDRADPPTVIVHAGARVG